MRIGDTISGFEVLDTRRIPEHRGEGVYLEHRRSGCRVLHLRNDDEENFFCFGFKTPPPDSSGVPHIVEHTVLSGSRSYPLKDPFLALLKGSVNTFLNAMTYPDKTVFPAATVLPRDYYNLMLVYGDAVFRPLMREETFRQEGCRLELDDDGNLSVGGVVYNEMIGSYSSHDGIAGEWVNRGLFPDTPYRFDSGGEPDSIARLRYEEFLRFHSTHYDPSNCLIFLYGNIPTEEQLEFIDRKVLAGLSHDAAGARALIDLPRQTAWDAPRRLIRTSPAAPEGDLTGKSTIAVSWLTVPVSDLYESLGLLVLTEILLGNAGAPLQKSILDSGIGQDVSPVSGIDTDVSQAVCTFGIRGSDPERVEEFETFLIDELRRLAESGLPADTVEAGIKQIEFRNREIKGGIPFGLRLMGRAYRAWIHGADIFSALEFRPRMERVKAAAGYKPGVSRLGTKTEPDIESDTDTGNTVDSGSVRTAGYFEGLIRRWFLDNTHRLSLTVHPDHDHVAREMGKIDEYLGTLRREMSEADRDRIRRQNRHLAEFEATPDDPEQVAKVPRLGLSDLPSEVKIIETVVGTADGITVYTHPMHTNDIAYVDLAFDVRGLGQALSVYLPLFSRAVCGCGFPGVPWDRVARMLALKAGGLATFLESNLNIGTDDVYRELLFFRIKALREDAGEALGLLGRMLTEADFDDRERIRDLVLEQRNDFRASLQSAGHSLVSLRAAGRLAHTLATEEAWRGIDQYLFLNDLAEGLPESLDRLIDAFKRIRETIIVRRRICANLTGTEEMISELAVPVKSIFSGLQAGSPGTSSPTFTAKYSEAESFAVPGGVGYVGLAVPSVGIDSPLHTFELLLAHLLSTTLLWESVRMVGGAYGVSAANNGNDGVFTFSSYRDPRILETLEAYRTSLVMVRDGGVGVDELEKAIISVAGRELRPMAPSETSIVGFRRTLYGITDTLRRQKRDLLLAAGEDDIRGAAVALLEVLDNGSVSVMSTAEAIKATGNPGLLSSMTALPV